jgi:hypothetical protein
MLDTPIFPRLVFEFPFDESAAREARLRGYVSHVTVELETGERFPVFFYDPGRLAQELEIESRQGRAYISVPGMIVIPEVTLSYMKDAVSDLVKERYFEAFRQI